MVKTRIMIISVSVFFKILLNTHILKYVIITEFSYL